MPITRTNGNALAATQRLLGTLASRLLGDIDSPDLPLIVQNQIPRTRTVHLVVIWDKWQGVPTRERAAIITDAFARAHPAQTAAVAVPLGLTPSEALSLGFLPYRIVPAVRKSDNVSDRRILDAMRSVGGVFIQIGAEKQLRFATAAQAEDAYRAIATKVPGPVWTLVHEQAIAESA